MWVSPRGGLRGREGRQAGALLSTGRRRHRHRVRHTLGPDRASLPGGTPRTMPTRALADALGQATSSARVWSALAYGRLGVRLNDLRAAPQLMGSCLPPSYVPWYCSRKTSTFLSSHGFSARKRLKWQRTRTLHVLWNASCARASDPRTHIISIRARSSNTQQLHYSAAVHCASMQRECAALLVFAGSECCVHAHTSGFWQLSPTP